MDWEEQIQIALYNWFQLQYPKYARWFHHSPNGGWRKRATAGKLKAVGVQKGFPDICIFAPTALTSFLVIELKTSGSEGPKARRGRPTIEQQEWLVHLRLCNAETSICYGFREAQNVINEYMKRVLAYHDIVYRDWEKEHGQRKNCT